MTDVAVANVSCQHLVLVDYKCIFSDKRFLMKKDALLERGVWINQPRSFHQDLDSVHITTEPNTDFWQRTYYGFRSSNAPALLCHSEENTALTVRIRFEYRNQFDQCGVLIYGDNENWFKASIEYENLSISRLGSVVTNNGYSDWATTDIPTCQQIWYRLSRRGPDFLIECSTDGRRFVQMRIFHLSVLGVTTDAMSKASALDLPATPVQIGIYACSPGNSSFCARFDNISNSPSCWQPHT